MTNPKGIVPFDLGLFFERMTLVYEPLRGTDADRRRAAQELAAERRKSAERFALAHINWAHALAIVPDSHVKAVMQLHKPFHLGDQITCIECTSYDGEGDNSPDWPCDTYKAVIINVKHDDDPR